MNLNQALDGDVQLVASPVFDGLGKLGVNGRDIAEITRVSAPTVSKWRNGHVPVPCEVTVLLTLILASCVEDVLEQKNDVNDESPIWSFGQRASLDAVRDDLSAQEALNHNLPPSAIRSGGIWFRYWWNAQMRSKMSGMSPGNRHINQIATAY